jgi:uncharacterized membrane protein (UPF0127 family)
MRFPIDVIFLSEEYSVVEIKENLPPWRLLLPRPKARHILEIPAHEARNAGIAKGAHLKCEVRE